MNMNISLNFKNKIDIKSFMKFSVEIMLTAFFSPSDNNLYLHFVETETRRRGVVYFRYECQVFQIRVIWEFLIKLLKLNLKKEVKHKNSISF